MDNISFAEQAYIFIESLNLCVFTHNFQLLTGIRKKQKFTKTFQQSLISYFPTQLSPMLYYFAWSSLQPKGGHENVKILMNLCDQKPN